MSNRSQKKTLNRHIKVNDPEALLAAGGEFQQRVHKRDGRKRDYLRTVDAEKILGMGKEKTLQAYTYQVPLELVIQEAQVLFSNHGKDGESWVQYIVSAHHNVSATGFVKKRTTSHSKEHGIGWIAVNYPDYSEQKLTEEGCTLKTTVKLPSKYSLKSTVKTTITQTLVTIKK